MENETPLTVSQFCLGKHNGAAFSECAGDNVSIVGILLPTVAVSCGLFPALEVLSVPSVLQVDT